MWLNRTFEKLHRDYEALEWECRGLDRKYAEQAAQIHDRWRREREGLDRTREEILKYDRVARDVYRQKPSRRISPKKPDLARLNSLIGNINPERENDFIAGEVVGLAEDYFLYLDREKQDMEGREQAEVKAASESKNRELAELARKKKQISARCRQLVGGNEIYRLVSGFDKLHDSSEITPDYFEKWRLPQAGRKKLLLGYLQYPVAVPKGILEDFKKRLQNHFDVSRRLVDCPFGFSVDSYEDIFVEYTDLGEPELKGGLQALILNFMRTFRPEEYRISLFDFVHYNGELVGSLTGLAKEKKGIMDPVPCHMDSLRKGISALAAYYRKVEARTGAMTVYEYNQQCEAEKRIPYRTVIINRQDQGYGLLGDSEMDYVLNNAGKFGLTVVRLMKTPQGFYGTDREKRYATGNPNRVSIISDDKGRFYLFDDGWMEFHWLKAPVRMPAGFAGRMDGMLKAPQVGTDYFKRYSMHLPVKSKRQRRPISVPFAIDEEDRVISCDFENENFAAYMMGAARSGKSTLLNTIISGLIMNYHPDEVELWMMDFKMLGFRRFINFVPPHVKYILLEKSEDLVFDILDRLTELLKEREYLFSGRGWEKLSEVPPEENIPAIFVIVDEFAQMSQIIRETAGSGYERDYTIKLENLLAKGGALGFKFIFASQSYTTGVTGLTETACKQIQMRFALKGVREEIRQTLNLSAEEITPEISGWMSNLPRYETLFRWRDERDVLRTGRFRNLYVEGAQLEMLITMLNSSIKKVPPGSHTDDSSCIDKKPVAIDGRHPKTFKSQVPYYVENDRRRKEEDGDAAGIPIYGGVPCSFQLARPFVLERGISENILIAGGERAGRTSVIISVINCYVKTKHPVEVWSHQRNETYRKYGSGVFGRFQVETEVGEICSRIRQMKEGIRRREQEERLIVVLGYEMLVRDMEILGEDAAFDRGTEEKPVKEKAPDLSETMEKIRNCSDPEEKKRILAAYNAQAAQYNAWQAQEQEENAGEGMIYDAREDFGWVLKRAPDFGIHFLLDFERAGDFEEAKLDEKAFLHKILFSMSREDSYGILGNPRAAGLKEDVCVYSDGRETFTMKPHLYRAVPRDGFMVDETGNVVQRSNVPTG